MGSAQLFQCQNVRIFWLITAKKIEDKFSFHLTGLSVFDIDIKYSTQADNCKQQEMAKEPKKKLKEILPKTNKIKSQS